jgi:hypothetical protein
MPNSISTPDPYAGNPIIDQAEQALRAFGEDLSVADAARLLPLWRHNSELTGRERAAILNRFGTLNASSSGRRGTHAFTVQRTNGDHFVWTCRCGHIIVQDPQNVTIHRDLIAHAGVSA